MIQLPVLGAQVVLVLAADCLRVRERRKAPRYTDSAGPGWPPVWYLAEPTPAGEVMAQATARWNGVISLGRHDAADVDRAGLRQSPHGRGDVSRRQQRVPVHPDEDVMARRLIAAFKADRDLP